MNRGSLRGSPIEAEFEVLLSGLDGWAAGITTDPSGEGRSGSADFGLSTGGSAWDVSERYLALAHRLDFGAAAVARQVHGVALVDSRQAPDGGLWIAGDADGFVGPAMPGRLFCVTVADCVPVYLLTPEGAAFALLHAGWRGAAGGILPVAIERLCRAEGVESTDLRVHLGPAICAECYVVGQEVPDGFDLSPADREAVVRPVDPADSAGSVRFDLRGALACQARLAGVDLSKITVSASCTRCGAADGLFSHRGGGDSAGRMIAWLGRRT